MKRVYERIIGAIVALLGLALFEYIINNVTTCDAPRACSSAAAGLPLLVPMIMMLVGIMVLFQREGW